MIELFGFARYFRAMFKPDPIHTRRLTEFLTDHPGNYRVIADRPNAATSARALNIWCYDPITLKRYMQFMAVTQAIDDGDAGVSVSISRAHRSRRMLRCRYMTRLAADQLHTRHYQLMPANYVLRGIPLSAGEHQRRVSYEPAGFVVGKWVSIAASIVFLALVAWAWTRARLPEKRLMGR